MIVFPPYLQFLSPWMVETANSEGRLYFLLRITKDKERTKTQNEDNGRKSFLASFLFAPPNPLLELICLPWRHNWYIISLGIWSTGHEGNLIILWPISYHMLLSESKMNSTLFSKLTIIKQKLTIARVFLAEVKVE